MLTTYTYIIGMNFISWMLAIMMSLGFLYLKICEREINNPNSRTDDITRDAMQIIVDDYNSRSWSGRVVFILWYGAVWLSMLFTIPQKKDDN